MHCVSSQPLYTIALYYDMIYSVPTHLCVQLKSMLQAQYNDRQERTICFH